VPSPRQASGLSRRWLMCAGQLLIANASKPVMIDVNERTHEDRGMVKKIRDNQILGQKGIALIETTVLDMGFTWHPTNGPLEAGIDGWIELRDQGTGEVANCWLPVQSKARTTLAPENDTSVSFTCGLSDMEYWMTGNAPVILIVSKPDQKEAWWVSVKDYFRGRDIRKDRKITFDRVKNRFSPDAADELKALGSRVGAGAYFTPVRRQEALVSNLLRVKSWKEIVFKAPTVHRRPSDLRAALKTHVEWPEKEWLLHEGSLFSFHDLSAPPWCHECDADLMTTFSTSEWAFSDSADHQWLFVRLLNQCLRDIAGRAGMSYSDEDECFYFRPTKDLTEKVVQYHSQKRSADRVVFKAHPSKLDPTKIAYYRHDGFAGRFKRYGDAWFLEISPTYRFTSDGRQPSPYGEDNLAGIKRLEGDGAVAGRVIMYADLLRERPSLFHKRYSFLTFGELEHVVMDVSINDEAWRRIREDSSTQDEELAEVDDEQGKLFDR